MNKTEMTKILAVLRTYFPNGVEASKTVVEAWHMIFEKVPYELMNNAVKEVVSEWEGYTMPPPGVFMSKLRQTNQASAVELWNEAHNLMRRGTILTQDEFEQASPEIVKYFGSVARIRQLATMPVEEVEFEKQLFMKHVPSIQGQQIHKKQLADNTKALLEGLSERMKVE